MEQANASGFAVRDHLTLFFAFSIFHSGGHGVLYECKIFACAWKYWCCVLFYRTNGESKHRAFFYVEAAKTQCRLAETTM